VQYNFVSPEDEKEQVGGIVGVIFGGILVTLLVVGLIQGALLKGSKKGLHQPGEPRNYGMLGGTVCPKCGRPFPRHLFGIKLIVGRLDRCDNCGKWVMTNRATPAALRAAEEAEKADLVADEAVTAVKEDNSPSLDDTRYMDDL
jgi:ribosomal protein L32